MYFEANSAALIVKERTGSKFFVGNAALL